MLFMYLINLYITFCAGMFQSKTKHHAVSAKLDKVVDFTTDSFVVQ